MPGRRLGIGALVLLVAGAVLTLAVALGVGVLFGDGYVSRSIPSDSMDPTYRLGDTAYFTVAAGKEVRRGDIALISAPTWIPEADILKRVVALGGDRISYEPGDPTLTLNGEPLVEPYLKDRARPAVAAFDVTVPEGRMFVMGDNRENSFDSHLRISDHDGTLPISAVRGRATATPVGFLAAGAAGVLGIVVFLVGGALGVAALVVRGRARRVRRA
ncbi:signal peptidase I [Streptomyces sp. APSN-46.1]|uniref:signal peptidase I n=1 Tax=Streptomyces sp. APSN-46.1 TaxID=2929049 RepID=UPI001FB4AAD2|nr:signal peptidase I [Streptomyces sp. APSN-46.1]MCJ1678872.1 signal peptidase I [Streptomyces sp. APSN-46.1]